MTSGGGAVLADIGGTNARFAVYRAGRISDVWRSAVADHATLGEALAAFLARPEIAKVGDISYALVAIAGPVEKGHGRLTNGIWTANASELNDRFSLKESHIFNDFEAIAHALPVLNKDDLTQVGSGRAQPGLMAAIGPGTGLGISAFLPTAAAHGIALVTEGGHATMAAANDREAGVLTRLRARFGHVSAERVLSGPGLENLYQAIAEVDGTEAPPRNAREIMESALAGGCDTSGAALDMFFEMLGTIAGNLALTLNARGGVFIAGGIVPRALERFQNSGFRRRFESKGRFTQVVQEIPTSVLTHPCPALVGLAGLHRRAMARRT